MLVSMKTAVGALVSALLLAIMAGCAVRRGEVVGTWDADLPQQSSRGTVGDELLNGIMSFAGENALLEFNQKGRYKATLVTNFMSVKGNWTVNGDLVELVQDRDEKDPKSKVEPIKLVLSKDGKTLSSIKEFDSDPQLVFRKRTTGAQAPEPASHEIPTEPSTK